MLSSWVWRGRCRSTWRRMLLGVSKYKWVNNTLHICWMQSVALHTVVTDNHIPICLLVIYQCHGFLDFVSWPCMYQCSYTPNTLETCSPDFLPRILPRNYVAIYINQQDPEQNTWAQGGVTCNSQLLFILQILFCLFQVRPQISGKVSKLAFSTIIL